MDDRFFYRMEGTQNDVDGDPKQGKPAGPRLASEHEHSAQDGQQIYEFNPKAVVVEPPVCAECRKVGNGTNASDKNIDPREHSYGNRA